jgi:hypothetical protein
MRIGWKNVINKWHTYEKGKPTKIQFDIEKQSNGTIKSKQLFKYGKLIN